jgi:hypothetical protein
VKRPLLFNDSRAGDALDRCPPGRRYRSRDHADHEPRLVDLHPGAPPGMGDLVLWASPSSSTQTRIRLGMGLSVWAGWARDRFNEAPGPGRCQRRPTAVKAAWRSPRPPPTARRRWLRSTGTTTSRSPRRAGWPCSYRRSCCDAAALASTSRRPRQARRCRAGLHPTGLLVAEKSAMSCAGSTAVTAMLDRLALRALTPPL